MADDLKETGSEQERKGFFSQFEQQKESILWLCTKGIMCLNTDKEY